MSGDNDDLGKLLSSATLVLVGTALGSMSKLIERVIMARWLSPESFGDINIALAILNFSVTLSLVGLNQGVPRFVSRYNDDRDIRGVWVTGLLVSGGVSLFLVGGVLIFGSPSKIGRLFNMSSGLLLLLFLLGLPFVVGQTVAVGTIRGLENTIYKTYIQDLFYPWLRIVLLVVLLVGGFGVVSAGFAYIAGAIAGFVFAHVLLNRLVSIRGQVKLHVREMLIFSAPLVVATVLSRLLTWTDTLMLGYFRSSYEVGLYGAAYPLANGLVLLFSAFGFMYLPLTSRLDANNDRKRINDVFQITTKWIFAMTFPAFLVLTVFPDDILRIVFGADYTPASLALSILALGFFVHAATGRNRETISALGFTHYIFVSNAIAFVINVGLNLVLIPAYGIEGAAVASSFTYAVLNLFVNAILKIKFDISSVSPTSLRTFVLLPLILIPIALAVSQEVSMTLPILFVMLAAGALATIVVLSVGGCLQAEDEVFIEFVERGLGRSIPMIRRFLPKPGAGD